MFGSRPVNFIHETRDRWVYAVIFGSLSGTFIQMTFKGINFEANFPGVLGSFLRGMQYAN